MEVYVFFSLMGLGYALSSKSKTQTTVNKPIKREVNTPYDTNIMESVYKAEQSKAQQKFKKSMSPSKSKVISSTYRDIVDQKQSNEYESLLSGQKIPLDNFTHTNMEPFFGGTIKQNMDVSSSHASLERHTGMSDIINIAKQEEVCFADVAKNSGSSPNNNTTSYREEYERMINGTKKTNELPFDQIRVGPGISKDYGHTTSQEGFQPNDRDHVHIKTIDELRQGSNPQKSYTTRPTEGIKGTRRGISGKVFKNKESTFFEQSQDQLLKTTGAYSKDKYRSTIIVKDTNRKDAVAYAGNIYKNIGNEQSSKLQATKKNILEKFGERNANLTSVGNSKNDFGKNNILVYSNERDVTSTRTYEGNLTSLVKSIISPIQDVLKPTVKDYNVMNNQREFGELQTNVPKKQTMYDPSDVARTTIKETNIHDNRTGNIIGQKASIVYDPDDVTKATMKETLPDYDNVINMKSKHVKSTIYDPTDKTRTTMRETTETNLHDGHIGNVDGAGGYETNEFNAPSTNKQFLSDHEHMGVGPNKPSANGYLSSEFKAESTAKQFISDNDYYGQAASSDKKQTSYDDIYNASMNDIKEKLYVNRKPTQNGVKVANGKDTVNMDSKPQCLSNMHELVVERVQERSLHTDAINITQHKTDFVDRSEERLDPDILKAFHDNPYTKSLNESI